MDWIKINDEGEVEFVSEEVKLKRQVQPLLTLAYNKGTKGDMDGRLRKKAKNELKYLFLAYSYKSPYKDYNEAERIYEARLDCTLPSTWQESEELQALVPEFTRGTENKVMKMLLTVHRFMDKFEKHLNSLDLEERDKGGNYVNSAKEVIATLEKLPRLAETLQELENQAKLGVVLKSSSRGDQELGWMNKENNYGKQRISSGQDESGEGV